MGNGLLVVLAMVAFMIAAVADKNGRDGGGYATAGAVMLSAGVAIHYWRHPPPTRDVR